MARTRFHPPPEATMAEALATFRSEVAAADRNIASVELATSKAASVPATTRGGCSCT